MEKIAEFGGFVAAHAIWSVSDGSTLVPILAVEKPDGSRELRRYPADRLEDGVAKARESFERNPDAGLRAVFVADGYLPLESGKTDALLVQAREYGPVPHDFTIGIPYRPPGPAGRFVVYRPKFLSFVGGPSESNALAAAFFRGVDKHEKGAAIWNASIDQSR